MIKVTIRPAELELHSKYFKCTYEHRIILTRFLFIKQLNLVEYMLHEVAM